MKKDSDYIKILDFLAEAGQLKRVKRSGWWTCGINDCESVADHSFRCAIIGFCLAKIEKCDFNKTAIICLFNDLHEARINDMHKVVQRYILLRDAEKKASKEQVKDLFYGIGKNIMSMMNELWEDKSKESIIARDADILECMLQGKEYYDQGFTQAKEFYIKPYKLLKTKSARKLARYIKKWDSRSWCSKLAVVER